MSPSRKISLKKSNPKQPCPKKKLLGKFYELGLTEHALAHIGLHVESQTVNTLHLRDIRKLNLIGLQSLSAHSQITLIDQVIKNRQSLAEQNKNALESLLSPTQDDATSERTGYREIQNAIDDLEQLFAKIDPSLESLTSEEITMLRSVLKRHSLRILDLLISVVTVSRRSNVRL